MHETNLYQTCDIGADLKSKMTSTTTEQFEIEHYGKYKQTASTMFCGDGHLGFHIHKFELLHSCSLSGPCQTMFFGGGGGHLGFQIGTKITSLVEISLDITCLMYWCGMTSQKKLFVCHL
jgi:hypothetical protein